MQAMLTAYNDWNARISKGRFMLNDQIVEVARRTPRTIEVVIFPRPYRGGTLGGGNRYGIEMHYLIDEASGRVGRAPRRDLNLALES